MGISMKYNVIASILLLSSVSVVAEPIDLQCEALAVKMVKRLAADGLLNNAENVQQRATDISIELCTGVEKTAQIQAEADKENALKNWLLNNTGGKPGNKRLKNLKR